MKVRGALASAMVGSLLLLTACSGKSATPTHSDQDTIVIGSLETQVFPKVAKAWVDDINASGGIDGRQVSLITIDTTNSSGLEAARKLVDQDHVAAIVGYTDPTVSTWGPYVAAKKVPIIGGLPIDLLATTNADIFPVGANVFADAYGLLVQAKKLGPNLGVLYCAENTQCANVQLLLNFLGGPLGVQANVSVKVATEGTTDYTAACQALIDGKVQSYTVGADGPAVVKIAEQCARMGLTAPYVATGPTVRTSFATTPALNGSLIADSTAPFFDDSVPATKKYQDLIAPLNLGDGNGPIAFYTYASFELFKKALENAAVPKGQTVASDDLRRGLYQMKEETLGGITPPLTFVAGQPTLVNCYFTFTVSNGKFVAPNGLKTECAPDDAIASIVKLAASAS